MESRAAFTPFSLNLPGGRLIEYKRPQVMGILNVTPDSFFCGSRTMDAEAIENRVSKMIEEGVDMIDIGAYSSRPGASDVPEEEELRRLSIGMKIVRAIAPEIPVSVDTFRAQVAKKAVEEMGVDIINDISGGNIDPSIWEVAAELHVPYILMHMRGTPTDMMEYTQYEHVTRDVMSELGDRLQQLALLGVADIIIDPGFGFSKTSEQNFHLLADLPMFHLFHRPILVGISRKSMLSRPLGISPETALNATTVANTIALIHGGASILRVHDVAEARQAIAITALTINA